MNTLKICLLFVALSFTATTNAAITNLGTLVPQETENVFSLFSASVGDDYTFTVNDSFAFTSVVDAYDVANFGITLSDTGGLLFGQDSLTTTTPITGFSNGFTAEITERILGAGSYTFSIVGNSTDTTSVYTGSLTVGRASAVAAVPEPSSYMMFLAGLGLLGFVNRRKT